MVPFAGERDLTGDVDRDAFNQALRPGHGPSLLCERPTNLQIRLRNGRISCDCPLLNARFAKARCLSRGAGFW
jgi:hypothetical protein